MIEFENQFENAVLKTKINNWIHKMSYEHSF